MKIYKLHELILMARAGKKFRATYKSYPCWINNRQVLIRIWDTTSITADWMVEFEPEVIEFESDNKSGWICIYNQKLAGKRWRIVATEKVEDK